jgi:hypothetical protein
MLSMQSENDITIKGSSVMDFGLWYIAVWKSCNYFCLLARCYITVEPLDNFWSHMLEMADQVCVKAKWMDSGWVVLIEY